ncbi:unnamed protein product [Agarophyton chilense]|eukprot:gb/GEZJ01000761.1/.p1 GENE.gb/GEZJ01000761.1/~~gb/GEZJ01000761.1/.p1  ORF type:complete len:623 (+),score=90.43 gb/GEZJ01000761.1/:639-2507(+)
MLENGEISPAVKNAKVLKLAREELTQRSLYISEQYKASLRIGSGVLQTVRMIENLHNIMEKKRSQNENVNRMERQLESARASLMQAIRTYDEDRILEAERIAEQLTLSYDPVYLEMEEDRWNRYQEEKSNQNRQKVTWASNPPSRFVSLMKGDFEGVQEVTEAEQRSCVSKCAWLFAIIGLIVALGFLVADFWYAQAKPAITSTVIRNERLQMPIIHLCSEFPFLPAFENLTREEYAGETLFGLRSYTNLDNDETITYPKTKELVSEPSLLGNPEYCSENMRYISKKRIVSALNGEADPNRLCYSCLRVGQKKPIFLNAERAKYRSLGAVTFESAISYDMEYCFNPSMVIAGWLKANMRFSIETHWDRLLEEKIITIFDAPDADYVKNNGFDHLRGSPEVLAATQAAIYCNIYFFSGFFFPVQPGTQIRYGFDFSRIDPWVRLSNDEYYLETQTEVINPFTEQSSNRAMVLDIIRNAKRGASDEQRIGVNLFVLDTGKDRSPKPHDFVGSLRENHRDVLLLTREEDNEQPRYVKKIIAGPKKLFVSVGRFARFNVSVDFATFDTVLVSRRPTTSLPEFLTDVFEYVGLFTGICAYTLIVGPARLYLKMFKSDKLQESGSVRP